MVCMLFILTHAGLRNTCAVFWEAVIERERDMACQPGSSGGSAEGFSFWRLRRAVSGGDIGILVLRFGVRHVHSIPISWHCLDE
jgi:hypothetical protein